MPASFANDIATIQAIPAISTMLDVVCRSTGMGFAAVARVTEDRWIACQVLDNIDFGLAPSGELKVETTICHEIRQHNEIVVIENVDEDPVYAHHHTPRTYGLQSYISMPIILRDGTFFGTLCAIDPRPAKLKTPEIIGTFKLFAELIAYHFDAERALENSQVAIKSAESLSVLRDEFIAILGHDLRNPLASIDAGTSILSREPQSERSVNVITKMRASVERMGGLIETVLDFARGRLARGIVINRDARDMRPTLEQVISEIQLNHPDRLIKADFNLNEPVNADHGRIAQMFSNLLGNAINHGDKDGTIIVSASLAGAEFDLSVTNQGDPIAADKLDLLFQPFYRGNPETKVEGLGLGLYISSQIAEAHGGRLGVVSDEIKTKFTFTMPVTPGSP